jgi:hypothetical protein
VDSPQKLLAKIKQLAGRPWFDGEVARALVLAVAQHFAWSLDDPALAEVAQEMARWGGPAG